MIIWSSSIVSVLALVLVVHIYMVTHKDKSDQPMIQLSRIDFKQEIDSTEAGRIRSFVAQLEGVKSTYFNVQDNILVYTYALDKQSSTNVYNKLMAYGKYNAERYTVDAATAAKSGCPIGAGKNSVSYHLTSYLGKLFN